MISFCDSSTTQHRLWITECFFKLLLYLEYKFRDVLLIWRIIFNNKYYITWYFIDVDKICDQWSRIRMLSFARENSQTCKSMIHNFHKGKYMVFCEFNAMKREKNWKKTCGLSRKYACNCSKMPNAVSNFRRASISVSFAVNGSFFFVLLLFEEEKKHEENCFVILVFILLVSVELCRFRRIQETSCTPITCVIELYIWQSFLWPIFCEY